MFRKYYFMHATGYDVTGKEVSAHHRVVRAGFFQDAVDVAEEYKNILEGIYGDRRFVIKAMSKV